MLRQRNTNYAQNAPNRPDKRQILSKANKFHSKEREKCKLKIELLEKYERSIHKELPKTGGCSLLLLENFFNSPFIYEDIPTKLEYSFETMTW